MMPRRAGDRKPCGGPAPIQVGDGPYAIAIDTANNKAYVANLTGENLTVIDGNTLGGSPAKTY